MYPQTSIGPKYCAFYMKKNKVSAHGLGLLVQLSWRVAPPLEAPPSCKTKWNIDWWNLFSNFALINMLSFYTVRQPSPPYYIQFSFEVWVTQKLPSPLTYKSTHFMCSPTYLPSDMWVIFWVPEGSNFWSYPELPPLQSETQRLRAYLV